MGEDRFKINKVLFSICEKMWEKIRDQRCLPSADSIYFKYKFMEACYTNSKKKLTKEEEKTVIELAKKRGIEKVSKISTFYIRPSSARGISVHGVEQVKGREILNSILTVNRKGWTHAGRVPGKADIQFGDFWAGKASIRKTTILMVDKKEYRISSPHGLTTEQCDSMLKKLQNGKYILAPNAQKERLKGIDWKKPTSFSKFGDNISASFSAKGRESGWYTLNISLDGEKLLISEIMLAMP